jgi:hypothetical protein
MNYKAVRALSVFLVVAMLFIAGCNLTIGLPPPSSAVGPTSDTRLDQQFIDTIGGNVELNSGITMVRVTGGISIDSPINAAQDMTIMVFNHVDEPVVFPNQAFGLRIFQVNPEVVMWEEIELQTYPHPTAETLPPRLEQYDAVINNMWSLFPNSFPDLDHLQVRLYVQGVGDETATKYGAFLDAVLKP